VQLDEDTLARRRRDLGEDHPDTLAAASGLAVSLRAAGEYQAARCSRPFMVSVKVPVSVSVSGCE